MTRMVGVSQSWVALDPCAEPMCEAAENLSHVSPGVLVTVKSMIYSNKEYSVFGNMCKTTDGDNRYYVLYDAAKFAMGLSSLGLVNISGFFLRGPPPPTPQSAVK